MIIVVLETNERAAHPAGVPVVYEACSLFFLLLYSAEIFIGIFVDRWSYFNRTEN